jgi:hypothetical protein
MFNAGVVIIIMCEYEYLDGFADLQLRLELSIAQIHWRGKRKCPRDTAWFRFALAAFAFCSPPPYLIGEWFRR